MLCFYLQELVIAFGLVECFGFIALYIGCHYVTELQVVLVFDFFSMTVLLSVVLLIFVLSCGHQNR